MEFGIGGTELAWYMSRSSENQQPAEVSSRFNFYEKELASDPAWKGERRRPRGTFHRAQFEITQVFCHLMRTNGLGDVYLQLLMITS